MASDAPTEADLYLDGRPPLAWEFRHLPPAFGEGYHSGWIVMGAILADGSWLEWYRYRASEAQASSGEYPWRSEHPQS
jgi:hypothetical protein